MKRKLKGITIPYLYYSKKDNYTYYVYKDKKYINQNELFNDFIGFYLTYHYEINDNLKEVHNLSDVLYDLIKNKKDFKIPTKYKKEYSDEEYRYIKKLKEKLVKKELVLSYQANENFNFHLKDLKEYKIYKFYKNIYNTYHDISIPKLIYSEEFHNNYYVIAGFPYQSLYHALDEVFNDNLYYEYGGTKRTNNRSFSHCHNFDDLVNSCFKDNKNFKIHRHQYCFYSEQELTFLNALATELRKKNYHSVERKYDSLDSDEYIYLKENNKIFRLFINNLKYYNEERKYRNEILKSHKI